MSPILATMTSTRRPVLLLQLPIPPAGLVPIHGNIPLAAGYLKMYARRQGLEQAYGLELLPTSLVNTLSEQGLVEEILARQPWLVGFTCYVWNIERTLWIAERLKQHRPDLKIVLGGPEVTADNAWVLDRGVLDYAVVGEGEQTFSELLTALIRESSPARPIPGLCVPPHRQSPLQRTPLANLDEISSPYLEGILDAADEQTLFLETVRGCAFKCRFCYYPKSYDTVYLVSPEQVLANLRHAVERGARDVVILDPTLNQRRDFPEFLRLLAAANPQRQLTYFAELRAEGLTPATARWLQAANFTEVEVGVQSVDRYAQELMNRPVNLPAFRRGVQALQAEGLRVKLDLIIGLPGDTVDSVRRGIDFVSGLRASGGVQIFNLSVLPGTAFREQAAQLGLDYQPRPPYFVLNTPTLSVEQIVRLMEEAQDALGIDFDPLPPPLGDLAGDESGFRRGCRIDLDRGLAALPPPEQRCQAFLLWLRSARFAQRVAVAAELIAQVLSDNPHTTLQVTLEPTAAPEQLTAAALESLRAACFRSTSYLDRYYSLQPAGLWGAKRLVVVVPSGEQRRLGSGWRKMVAEYATIIWRGTESHEDVRDGP